MTPPLNPCYDKFFEDHDGRFVCGDCGVDYPVTPRTMKCKRLDGTGSRLKELLSHPPLSIQKRYGCPCLRLMRLMNTWTPDQCEEPENFRMIVNQLQHEAQARSWPLASSRIAEWGAEWLVRRAIANERKRLREKP